MLKATYYETHAKDFIYSIYKCNEGRQKIYEKKNVGKIRIKGVELEANCKFNEDWSFFANYTFNESKVTEHEDKPELEGKYLALSPKEKYAFGITYSNPEIITVRLTGRYVGMRYNDDNNEVELESYFTTDLKLSRQIGKYLEAALSVTNINDVHFEEASGYKSPGRMIMGTVKLTF